MSEIAPMESAHRLHPTSLLFSVVSAARNLLVPGLMVLFLSREGGNWEVWLMLLFIPAVLFGIARYISVRYRFAVDEVELKDGILFRNERHIPFVRIQNIDLVQNPLHRLLRVAEVRLETASGSEPEAVLKVLSLKAVKTMRERVFAGRRAVVAEAGAEVEVAAADDGETTAEPEAIPAAMDLPLDDSDGHEGRLIFEVPPSELVKLALISNRGMALVAAALGIAWELDLHENFRAFIVIDPILGLLDPAALWVVGLTTILAGVVLLCTLSVIWTFLRLYGFSVRLAGDDIRLSCGLLTKLSATVPRHRIQFISIQESVPHRWFRRVSVRMETAGGAEEGASTLSRKWFLPVISKSDAARVLEEVQPGFRVPALHGPDQRWLPLARKARTRMVRRAIAIGSIVGGIVMLIVGPWGAVVWGLLTALLIVFAWAEARFAAYAKDATGIFYRSGVWTRRVSKTLFEKIQVVTLNRSPFDRRHGHASLAVDTAGSGPANHKIHIPYLEREVAEGLFDEISSVTEGSSFRW